MSKRIRKGPAVAIAFAVIVLGAFVIAGIVNSAPPLPTQSPYPQQPQQTGVYYKPGTVVYV